MPRYLPNLSTLILPKNLPVLYFLLIAFCFIQCKGRNNSIPINTKPQYIFFEYADILKLGIDTILIKNMPGNNCWYRDTLNCERIFVFKNGKIVCEICDDGSREKNDRMYRDDYNYESYDTDSIIIRFLHFEYGAGRTYYTREYKYVNNKLMSSVDLASYTYMNDEGYYETDVDYDNLRKYFYNLDGKLSYCSIGYIEGNDTIFSSNIYFLYSNDNLIGYYPAKCKNFNGKWNESDSIYYEKKIKEVKIIGFEKFKEKYLQNEVLEKVIDDCYVPIRSEQLLINGKPIKEFLSGTGNPDAQYIIFEVTDNYFLFYKITD